MSIRYQPGARGGGGVGGGGRSGGGGGRREEREGGEWGNVWKHCLRVQYETSDVCSLAEHNKHSMSCVDAETFVSPLSLSPHTLGREKPAETALRVRATCRIVL